MRLLQARQLFFDLCEVVYYLGQASNSQSSIWLKWWISEQLLHLMSLPDDVVANAKTSFQVGLNNQVLFLFEVYCCQLIHVSLDKFLHSSELPYFAAAASCASIVSPQPIYDSHLSFNCVSLFVYCQKHYPIINTNSESVIELDAINLINYVKPSYLSQHNISP